MAGVRFAAVLCASVAVLVCARAAEAQCTCTPPGNTTCNAGVGCAACTTTTSCCTCETQCAVIEPMCNAGYTSVGTESCPNPFQSARDCQTCATRFTTSCASCLLGYYGPTCVACPGGADDPCNGAGSCDQGIHGSGQCTCVDIHHAGDACQYSRDATCSSHGDPTGAGGCTCDSGFAGASCNQCAADYAGYPYCESICGDVTDDGAVDANDVALFRAYLATRNAALLTPNGADKCTVEPLVSGYPPCDILDLVVIRRSIQSPPLAPPRLAVCPFVSP
ncbi:MAG TPA: hypothetical protein VMR31_10930 [Myxococcota bacterium]|nr:hypothetical protein [Myxococcota bacterium]